MRQRLTIFLTIVLIVGVLAIINTVPLVTQKDDTQDYEFIPNRSSYHSGPTGTRALHDFLNESGYKVMRWREKPDRLLSDSGKLVTTFIVVGQVPISFTEDDFVAIRKWIERGGRYVIIDRNILSEPFGQGGSWKIKSQSFAFPSIDTDPADVAQMTESVVAIKPVQPTVLTSNVESILPSRFASRINIEATKPDDEKSDDNYEPFDDDEQEPELVSASPAPVVHISDNEGALLIDYNYGAGKVVLLSDPYLVSNGGIKLNDNLQLALNILTERDGLIAFDEYHQGKGLSQNAFAGYFAGTPVLPIAAQVILLVLLVLWTNARRFGRPLPLARIDRRSSLEFVASMAELQLRSRAFDLAIENIYTRTRRVLARHAGVDYNSSRSEIASRVAARSAIDAAKLEALMRQCEEAINGEPINGRDSLDLVKRLRKLERELGLQSRIRDERQAIETS